MTAVKHSLARIVNAQTGRSARVDVDQGEGGLKAIRMNFRMLGADQRGATAVEYGLIVALIVVAMIGGLAMLGGGAAGMWTKINTAMQSS